MFTNGFTFDQKFSRAMRRNPNKLGAIAMLDLGLALLLLVGLTAGVFAFSGSASSTSSSNDAMKNVSMIGEKIRQAFSSQTDFTGLDNAMAIGLGAVPSNWVSGANIRNGWNGAVTIAAGTPATQFTIALAAVPQEACASLGTFRQGEWAAVSIGATNIPQTGNIMNTVTTACGATNTITWTVAK